MLSKNYGNNKAVLATLTLMLLSLSVASPIAISASRYASAQGVTGQGDGYATNATTTSAGNATNATATGTSGGNTTASVSIVPGSSSLTTNAFSPNPIQVSVGTTVTWSNNDSQPHTVASGSNGQPDNKFNSSPNFNPLINPGQTFSHTFTQAGQYPYFCMLHPNMVGTVSVS
jgi:plastocyanin